MKIDELQFDEKGLVPAVVQEADTDEVLMMGFMNAEALRMTYETKLVTFWSRSRDELWTKGETSGNRLRLVTILYNCEDNSLLVKAKLDGDAVCHTGNRTLLFPRARGLGTMTSMDLLSDPLAAAPSVRQPSSNARPGGGRPHRWLPHTRKNSASRLRRGGFFHF